MNAATSSPKARASRRRRRTLSVWLAVVLWAAVMAPMLGWGLPSRAQDELLFGGQPAWPAERYDAADALRQRQLRQAGADTDLNPLATRERITHLTADESARTEILRRYRLFSRQPDEMITFMALQRMQPPRIEFDPELQRRVLRFDLDPKLYQYGGGYIYLIAATLAATSVVGITHLTSDAGVYLEQPELFAAFYVVARAITLVFGGLLLAAVWKLARRAAGRSAGWLALLIVACTPVFITGVLEAKPHLPSACMVLWAIISALDYHAHGRRRDALRMGWQTGYGFGLVLTGIVGAAIWPVLLLTRRRAANSSPPDRKRVWHHLLAAAGLAAGVYLLTNPYIPYNLLFNRQSLGSNFENSIAMYTDQMRQATAGAERVSWLLLESCGWGALLVGLAGFAYLLRKWPRETALPAAAGLAMLLICVLLGAGKPAEFARFLLLPVSLLGVAAAALLAALARRKRLWALAVALVVVLPMRTSTYVHSFVVDARSRHESRCSAARYLHEHPATTDAIAVLQEPAPYALPPLDFTRREIYWLPPAPPTALDPGRLPPWLVFTADDDSVHSRDWWTDYYQLWAAFPAEGWGLSRIAWADKPVLIYRRITPHENDAGR